MIATWRSPDRILSILHMGGHVLVAPPAPLLTDQHGGRVARINADVWKALKLNHTFHRQPVTHGGTRVTGYRYYLVRTP